MSSDACTDCGAGKESIIIVSRRCQVMPAPWIACSKCISNFHAPVGGDCIPCPESVLEDIGMLIFLLVVMAVVIYSLYTALDTRKKEETGDHASTLKKHNQAFQSSSSGGQTTRLSSVINIMVAHNIVLKFVFPTISLLHLPAWLRDGISSVLKLVAFDFGTLLSSPECQ